MNVKSYAKVGAAFGAAALGLGILAAPASADPVPATDYRQLAGVGSDTTQYVVNGLGDLTNANGKIIASWDALPPEGSTTTIKTKANGCSITRPNGSSAGIDALNADTAGCLDFARSSRKPANTTTADLTWIPFAKDAVTYATDLGTESTVPTNLTKQQLIDLYTCDTDRLPGIEPLLPQANSGTRSFWLTALGITEAQVGSCVVQGVQEHNGAGITEPNQLMPYSVAQWISQGKSLPGVPNRRGETRLRSINSVAPTTGSGSALALNPNFVTEFTRDVYNVVRSTQLTNAVIADTFVGATSKVCGAAGDTVVSTYGFGVINNCGDTTLKGER
ncbi:hypothetical protein [Streptomyces sp. 4N124]|uniref:hypothetical protein n=1 Tax=Streptomyces sp. 4N124 TaxID=3457420 RepID=UPI003FD500D3